MLRIFSEFFETRPRKLLNKRCICKKNMKPPFKKGIKFSILLHRKKTEGTSRGWRRWLIPELGETREAVGWII